MCVCVLGSKDKAHGALLKELMQTDHFRVTVVEEADVVEICGALKVSSPDSHLGPSSRLCFRLSITAEVELFHICGVLASSFQIKRSYARTPSPSIFHTQPVNC